MPWLCCCPSSGCHCWEQAYLGAMNSNPPVHGLCLSSCSSLSPGCHLMAQTRGVWSILLDILKFSLQCWCALSPYGRMLTTVEYSWVLPGVATGWRKMPHCSAKTMTTCWGRDGTCHHKTQDWSQKDKDQDQDSAWAKAAPELPLPLPFPNLNPLTLLGIIVIWRVPTTKHTASKYLLHSPFSQEHKGRYQVLRIGLGESHQEFTHQREAPSSGQVATDHSWKATGRQVPKVSECIERQGHYK